MKYFKKKWTIVFIFMLSLSIFFIYYKYRKPSAAPKTDPTWVVAHKVQEELLPLEMQTIGTLVARSVDMSPEMAGHVRHILFRDGAFVKKGTPLIQLDDALYRTKQTTAKARYTYQKNNYQRMALLGKKGVFAKQTIEQAEADLKEKQADLEESEVMLRKMQLVAPFDGVVGKSAVNLGDYVTVGQRVVNITDIEQLRIEYHVPEQYLPFIQLGQQVTVASSSYPDKIFSGKVSYIAPTISPENRSVSLYAEIPNPAHLLKSGMLVTVVQTYSKLEKALMVPARSIVPILDGMQIYKVQDNKAYPVTVKLGQRIGDRVQVIEGLTPNDMVITDGQQKIRNGVPVHIKQEGDPA